MTTWEYRSRYVLTSDNWDTASNALGVEGWELVAVHHGGTGYRCFFKRPTPRTDVARPADTRRVKPTPSKE